MSNQAPGAPKRGHGAPQIKYTALWSALQWSPPGAVTDCEVDQEIPDNWDLFFMPTKTIR